MSDFPATQPTFVQLDDDSTGNGDGDEQVVSQINVVYDEIEAMAAHLGAGKSVCANGGVLETLAESAATVGYSVGVAADNVAGTPIVLIPGGAWDVTALVGFMGVITASDGEVEFGYNYAVPGGDTITLFDDDTNTLTLTVSAGGEVSVVRGAGTLTFDVVLRLVWI